MKNLLVIPLLLLFTGCSLFTTPEVVYKDMNLIKENIIIQKRITDTLLGAVTPQDDKQVEALAMKKIEVEQRFDKMATGLNRLVTYFKAEREVGYLINVLDFMQESRLRGLLLSQEEREGYNNEELYSREDILLCYDDFEFDARGQWVYRSPESVR